MAVMMHSSCQSWAVDQSDIIIIEFSSNLLRLICLQEKKPVGNNTFMNIFTFPFFKNAISKLSTCIIISVHGKKKEKVL